MTKEQVDRFYKYMRSYYRNYKPGVDAEYDMGILLKDFEKDSFDDVRHCFKKAMEESKDPAFCPQFSVIRQKLNELYEERHRNSAEYLENAKEKAYRDAHLGKSREQVFRDTHCGKSEEEWKRFEEWEKSEEGIKSKEEFRRKLMEMNKKIASMELARSENER